MIDDTYVSNDPNSIFSALNGMRNLASNQSGYFYNATFAEMFNSKDADNDGIPDTDADVKELLDWVFVGDGVNQPSMIKISFIMKKPENTLFHTLCLQPNLKIYFMLKSVMN